MSETDVIKTSLTTGRPTTEGRAPVVFQHFSSTGGLSFVQAIQPLLARDEILNYDDSGSRYTFEQARRLPTEQRAKFRLVWGHLVHRANEVLPTRPVYATLLRHPVFKFVSDFNYCRVYRDSAHVQALPVHKSLSSLSDAIQFWHDSGEYAEFSHGHWIYKYWYTSPDKPPLSQHNAVERLARHYLDERFDFIGITDLFEESLVAFCRRYRLGFPMAWKRTSVARVPWNESALASNVIDTLMKLLAADVRIYSEFRARFERDFCADFYSDERAVDYKARAIAADERLLHHFQTRNPAYLSHPIRASSALCTQLDELVATYQLGLQKETREPRDVKESTYPVEQELLLR